MNLPNRTPIRFAVVGCGVIGRQHAAAISSLPGADLVAVVDTNHAAAATLAEAHDALPVTDVADLLARPDVDAVEICTPSGHHVEPALSALATGKHVVVEKPPDASLSAASRLADATAESENVVTVISQHRYDPASRVVHAAVQRGDFGTITSAVASVA